MKRQKYKYVLLLIDWLILNGSYIMAVRLHTSDNIEFLSRDFPYLHPDALFFGAYALVILLIFEMNQLYRINVCVSRTRQLQYLVKSLFYAAVGIAFLSFFTKSKLILDSRLVMFFFLFGSFVSLAIIRVVLFRWVFTYLGLHAIFPRTVLIVGAGEAGVHLGRILAEPNEYHLHLGGYLDDTKPVGSEVIPEVTVLGRTNDVAKVTKRHLIREILFCLEGVTDERFLEVLDLCTQTKALIMIGSGQVGAIPRRLNVEAYGEFPVFAVMNGVPAKAEPVLKKVFDPILALAGVIFLSPVFLLTALLIKLDSPGPVFYKHTRVGKNGRQFTFYKFRSMKVGSDRDEERKEKLRRFIGEGKADRSDTTKIVDEQKVTRVGRFIRKTSIDELPQLFNVLKGDMSLVGPRPCLPYEWESYAAWHKRRLSVTPGCTGVWQVLGRSEVGFRDMVILDLFYTYNISFHLDVWLVLKTIPVMLFGTGGK